VVVTTHSAIFNPLALRRLQKIKACTQLPEVLCQKCHKYEYLSTAMREEPDICAANIFLLHASRIATVISACCEFEYSAADCSNNLVLKLNFTQVPVTAPCPENGLSQKVISASLRKADACGANCGVC
jgi:hypothetical protein